MHTDASHPDLECLRYPTDGGTEHYVAQQAGAERIVATLRVDPVATAPLATLRRIGASALPEREGAYVTMSADADAQGTDGLAQLTAAALRHRRHEAGDTFWLAACADALLPTARALGWRALPAPAVPQPGTTPVVLLLDDAEAFARRGSALAEPARAASPNSDRLKGLMEAFGLAPDETSARRRARR